MTTIIASNPMTTVEGTSRAVLIQKLARATGLLQYGTSTAGGSTTTILDTTQLQSTQFSSKDWIGGWLRISGTNGHVAPEADIRAITAYDPATGTITCNPALSATAAAGMTYELWRINPHIVLDMIDGCLTDYIYIPCWTMLSEVPDSDMEQSGVANWTAVNSTVTKSVAEPRLTNSGKSYLSVLTTAANGYARTVLMSVEPARSYHASAAGRGTANSTTSQFQIWDESNNALIAQVQSTRQYPVRLYQNFLTPQGCNLISIRLGSLESAKTTNWDEVVCFPQSAVDIALPWWVKNRAQVKGVFTLAPLSVGTAGGPFAWDNVLRGERDTRWDLYKTAFGRDQMRAVARYGIMSWPLFILGTRNEVAYADDNTDLKYIDPPYLMSCLKWRLYRWAQQPLVTGLLDANNIKSQLASSEEDWLKLSYAWDEDLNQTIKSTTPMAEMLDERFKYGAS